jgi:hypothetical protein
VESKESRQLVLPRTSCSDSISKTSEKPARSRWLVWSLPFAFLAYLRPCKWKPYIPPKFRCISTKLRYLTTKMSQRCVNFDSANYISNSYVLQQTNNYQTNFWYHVRDWLLRVLISRKAWTRHSLCAERLKIIIFTPSCELGTILVNGKYVVILYLVWLSKKNSNNSVQLFIYLRVVLNSQGPITESTRIQNNNKNNHKDKTREQTNKKEAESIKVI